MAPVVGEEKTWQVVRVPTGVPNLDRLIDGGLTLGSMALIVGGTGTGKTVLAEQMAFYWAGQGKNVLWLVTLGEPNEKFLTNMSEMAFYDRRKIGAEIQLVNLTRYLRQGLGEQLEAIRETWRSGDYSFVIIDGFQTLRGFMEDQRAVRLFLSELSAELALAGITFIVTVDADLRHYSAAAEFYMADCIILLERTIADGREQRRLQVNKLRGRSVVGGHHSFCIDAAGLHIHPRIESLLLGAAPKVEDQAREPFGVPGLDDLLHGGIGRGTSTLVAGGIGTGKTLLANHFLAQGLRRGERCLSLCLSDQPATLLQQADRFGLPLRQAHESGALDIRGYDPAHPNPDACAWDLVRAVEEQGIRRLAVDGVDALEQDLERAERAYDYGVALLSYLQGRGVTSLFTYELPDLLGPTLHFPLPALARIVSNLILLRFAEAEGWLRSLLAVIKTRYSLHDPRVAEVLFEEARLDVVPLDRQPRGEPMRLINY